MERLNDEKQNVMYAQIMDFRNAWHRNDFGTAMKWPQTSYSCVIMKFLLTRPKRDLFVFFLAQRGHRTHKYPRNVSPSLREDFSMICNLSILLTWTWVKGNCSLGFPLLVSSSYFSGNSCCRKIRDISVFPPSRSNSSACLDEQHACAAGAGCRCRLSLRDDPLCFVCLPRSSHRVWGVGGLELTYFLFLSIC